MFILALDDLGLNALLCYMLLQYAGIFYCDILKKSKNFIFELTKSSKIVENLFTNNIMVVKTANNQFN